MKRLQEQQMKNRDQRTRLMSELLANIKRFALYFLVMASACSFLNSIKLYAWEYSFTRKILETRNDEEVKTLRKIGIVMVRSLNGCTIPVFSSPVIRL